MAYYSRFYFKIGGSWVYQGQTSGTSWSVGTLDLQYAHTYQWRIDVYDPESDVTATGDTWTFTIKNAPQSIDSDRPADYDEEAYWGYNPDTGEYEWMSAGSGADVEVRGGGRYKQYLIAVGHKTVYFGEI